MFFIKGYAKSQARSRSVSPQSMDITQGKDNATIALPVKGGNDKRQKRSAAAKASRFLDAVRFTTTTIYHGMKIYDCCS